MGNVQVSIQGQRLFPLVSIAEKDIETKSKLLVTITSIALTLTISLCIIFYFM